MPEDLPSLGELEARVLQFVWDEQPCTERQVFEALSEERELVRTTVLKTMQRLEAKGLLRRVSGAGSARFEAVIEKTQLLPSLVARFVSTILGGSSAPLVAYLAEERRLSPTDLAKLRAIARKLDHSSGT